jgi:glyoxylase-like metal-dependent hydrolase (beta-lactamase superfamily II)
MSTDIFSFSFGLNDCYVIRDKGTIMIDGGPPGKRDDFIKAVRNISIKPEDIKLIVITHGHPDHIGSAKDIKELTGAKVAMHQLDKQCLETGDWKTTHNTGAAKGSAWGWFMTKLGRVVSPFSGNVPSTGVELVIKDDGLRLEDYGIPGQIVYTPGHTMGSISVLLDSGEAFVGDLAMNRLPLRRTPGLPILAENIEKVKESWRHLIELGTTIVYPGHGKPFSIEVIKKALE